MTNTASHDDNRVTTLTGALNTDGLTVTPIKADPTVHTLMTSDGTTGTDHGPADAIQDANYVSSILAVSNVDGITPVVVYANSSGALLIQTT